MGCPVLSPFQLILGVLSKLTPDTFNKGMRASEVLSEEEFELRQLNRNRNFIAALVLSLYEADRATEKCGSKGDIIHPYSA